MKLIDIALDCCTVNAAYVQFWTT